MANPTKQDNCSLCGKKLHSLNTQLKKHEGKKICTGCAWKVAKGQIQETIKEGSNEQGESGAAPSTTQKVGKSLSKIGCLMTLFITIPILILLFLLF
jgi:hypothetical protein